MDATAVTRSVLANLPAEVKGALTRVGFVLRPALIDVDRARGATDLNRGYFYGVAPEPTSGTELPDETPAEGEIVIFTNGTSEDELVRTILHEIAHCTGHSEQEICEEMGLGA
jgi:hypothetical protein